MLLEVLLVARLVVVILLDVVLPVLLLHRLGAVVPVGISTPVVHHGGSFLGCPQPAPRAPVRAGQRCLLLAQRGTLVVKPRVVGTLKLNKFGIELLDFCAITLEFEGRPGVINKDKTAICFGK